MNKHEIIYTEHYALIVSDEILKKGDFPNYSYQFIEPVGGLLLTHHEPIVEDGFNGKKVIAHRPLTDAPVLEGVPLLPEWNVCDEELLVPFPKSTQTGRLRDGSEIKTWMLGWEEGFKEAKETYKYTEKDLMNLVEKGHEIYNEVLGVATDAKKQKLIDFISFLQQPKRPKYFECETTHDCCGRYMNCKGCDATADMLNIRMKTTANSPGQRELVGEYIF
jgi:hypothetical protein